ncbi:hypothetical protein AADY36_19075 [Pseudoalteromonas sp. D15MCD-2]|uniref:hypothetical protein n=1 Tax=Pseudoalteromonas sp. D15MCD-2 TaxID=3138933 RepID=UPI0031587286
MRWYLTLFIIAALAGCEKNTLPSGLKMEKSKVLTSSLGHKAYIVETSSVSGDVTQVFLDFANGTCGTGVLASYQLSAEFKLTWLTGSELQIKKTKPLEVQFNASWPLLRCSDHVVKVRVVEFEANNKI